MALFINPRNPTNSNVDKFNNSRKDQEIDIRCSPASIIPTKGIKSSQHMHASAYTENKNKANAVVRGI